MNQVNRFSAGWLDTILFDQDTQPVYIIPYFYFLKFILIYFFSFYSFNDNQKYEHGGIQPIEIYYILKGHFFNEFR